MATALPFELSFHFWSPFLIQWPRYQKSFQEMIYIRNIDKLNSNLTHLLMFRQCAAVTTQRSLMMEPEHLAVRFSNDNSMNAIHGASVMFAGDPPTMRPSCFSIIRSASDDLSIISKKPDQIWLSQKSFCPVFDVEGLQALLVTKWYIHWFTLCQLMLTLSISHNRQNINFLGLGEWEFVADRRWNLL